MSGYIGNIPTPQATQSRQSFTATASQTTFATVGYTAGFIDVYLNGVHLLDGTDYTATNGSDIVLTTGAALNDVLEFVAYETFSVLDQSFTGTTTVDVLSVTGAATGTDLTLSGGVYLGGAVAANYLDDYEEGTWTPTVSSGSASVTRGSYIKIGDQVTLSLTVGAFTDITSATIITITNIPFQSRLNDEYQNHGAVMFQNVDAGTNSLTAYINDGFNTLEFFENSSTGAWVAQKHSDILNVSGYLRTTISYTAA